jgi:small subunit ribosomal protein S3
MSKVVHPYAQRLPLIRDWKSRWFKTGKEYRELLRADILIREYLEKELRSHYVSSIEFERGPKVTRLMIATSRPGMVIGRSGEGVESLRKKLLTFMKRHAITPPEEFKIDVIDIPHPESDAAIVALMISEALEKRMPFRRVMKQMMEKVMGSKGVKGAKFILSGRLGGAEMARREELKEGGIPLQFLRADIDYAHHTARLPYGGIGVKVWIYKGDSLAQREQSHD